VARQLPRLVQLNKRELMWRAFKNIACSEQVRVWIPKKNNTSGEDYTDIFLAHARLYVLADRYDIPALRKLSVQKLRLNLVHFKLFSEGVGDIAALLEYAYTNTIDGHGSMDVLRDLVSDYAACHMETIGESPEFLALLEQPGTLAKNIMVKCLPLME
jgi:hypothetical protein